MGRPARDSLNAATDRLRLVWLSPEVMRGLLDGSVRDIDGVSVADEWAQGIAWLLRMRLEQIEREPRRAPWLLRAMMDRSVSRLIGHISFHGPPGSNALGAQDALELGFRVDPPFRRRGYASEAVLGMIGWAERERDIRRFVASVSPQNVASLGLVRKLGFVEVTRVMDEVDGEEIVFERRT